jgi:hypothetical protein
MNILLLELRHVSEIMSSIAMDDALEYYKSIGVRAYDNWNNVGKGPYMIVPCTACIRAEVFSKPLRPGLYTLDFGKTSYATRPYAYCTNSYDDALIALDWWYTSVLESRDVIQLLPLYKDITPIFSNIPFGKLIVFLPDYINTYTSDVHKFASKIGETQTVTRVGKMLPWADIDHALPTLLILPNGNWVNVMETNATSFLAVTILDGASLDAAATSICAASQLVIYSVAPVRNITATQVHVEDWITSPLIVLDILSQVWQAYQYGLAKVPSLIELYLK